MDDPLADALANVVEKVTFRNDWTDEPVDSDHIRMLWETRQWGDAHLSRRPDREWERDRHLRKYLSLNHLEITEDALDRLVGELVPLLAPFRQPRTGNVGNGVWLLRLGLHGMMHPTLRDFAELLVIAAARIGVPRVSELLRGWLDDEPLRVRKCGLIEGIELFDGRPLREVDGMEMYALPPRTDYFPGPFPSFGWLPLDSYRNKVVVSVDFDVTPALYAPTDGEPVERSSERQRWNTVNGSLSGAPFSFDRFCEAMALSLDGFVDWIVQWDDLGDLDAFSLTPPNSPRSKPASDPPSILIARNNVEESLSFYSKRQSTKDVDLAVARWLKSKRRASLEDKLIDLRIAMEALYMRNAQGEMRFRTAMNGAWHLGGSFGERLGYYETLNKVYDDASKVVHGNRLKDHLPSLERLEAAQSICRQSILKIVEDGEYPNWKEVVLGRGLDPR